MVSVSQLGLFPEDVGGTSELPARVMTLPFWEPFGSAAVDGIKNPETRTYPWPLSGPGHLVVYASHTVDPAAVDLLGARGAPYVKYGKRGRIIARYGGNLIGLLLISFSLPMTPDDAAGALIGYRADRHAWRIRKAWRFNAPVETRGNRGMWYTDRSVILSALGGSL